MKTATQEVPICWCSEKDDLADDFNIDGTNDWFVVSIFIQNQKNTKTLEDLRKDKEAMQLLADLQKLEAMEVEVYEDKRHESFNISVYFDNEEACVNCATTYGNVSYGAPPGPWHVLRMVEKNSK